MWVFKCVGLSELVSAEQFMVIDVKLSWNTDIYRFTQWLGLVVKCIQKIGHTFIAQVFLVSLVPLSIYIEWMKALNF